MRISRLLSFSIGIMTSLSLWGGPCCYVKNPYSFAIEETKTEYVVYCTRTDTVKSSRNKNIIDRQLRMTAVDLIGTYILFQSSSLYKDFGADYFPIYAHGLELHYNAHLEGLRQTETLYEGRNAICFTCDKDNYLIQSATYKEKFEIPGLLREYYRTNKGEESARLIYGYPNISLAQTLTLERDFLRGIVRLPGGIRRLQSIPDRFEQSVYTPSGEWTPPISDVAFSKVSAPYLLFCLEEQLTVAALEDKGELYECWITSLDSGRGLYESILQFCAKCCQAPWSSGKDLTLSDVILAFPGAISPFGIRTPIDDHSYREAAQYYSRSDFASAAAVLQTSIDSEGVSPETLNLLGASYRFLGQPKKALPFLLLCLKLEPSTPYLCGNIFLCLKQMNFPNLTTLSVELREISKDSWSKETFEQQ